VVACKDGDVLRPVAQQQVDVRVDGIGGAPVPHGLEPLLRRQQLDEFVEPAVEKTPGRCRWPIRLCALYCVHTPTRRRPELTQFDSAKSMMR